MNEPTPTGRRQASLGRIYVIVFAALAVLFFLASLGSEADPIGSIIAGAFFAAVVVIIMAIIRWATNRRVAR